MDVDGHTALIWAADKGNVEVANHLLSHPNIDPNLQVLDIIDQRFEGYLKARILKFYINPIVRTLRD